MVTPTMFPWDKKTLHKKKLEDTNVLIPWYPNPRSLVLFFLGGGHLWVPTYPTLRFGGAADGGWGR